jgi:hypothetical protein
MRILAAARPLAALALVMTSATAADFSPPPIVTRSSNDSDGVRTLIIGISGTILLGASPSEITTVGSLSETITFQWRIDDDGTAGAQLEHVVYRSRTQSAIVGESVADTEVSYNEEFDHPDDPNLEPDTWKSSQTTHTAPDPLLPGTAFGVTRQVTRNAGVFSGETPMGARVTDQFNNEVEAWRTNQGNFYLPLTDEVNATNIVTVGGNMVDQDVISRSVEWSRDRGDVIALLESAADNGNPQVTVGFSRAGRIATVGGAPVRPFGNLFTQALDAYQQEESDALSTIDEFDNLVGATLWPYIQQPIIIKVASLEAIPAGASRARHHAGPTQERAG